jgi:hypothetical protein
MTKQELKAKIDKLENGIKSKATPSNLIAPLKAQKAKFEKELQELEIAEKKAVKTKKVSKVAEKIKAAKTSVAKKTPAKAPAKEERKKDNIARDGDRKSLPSGKRISKSGKVYYETRANRSDKQTSVKPYLAKGGETDPMASVNEISRLTGLRPIAVAEWGDKNNINLSVVLKDLKSKKIKGMDLMTAVVGKPNNKYQKELLAKYSKSKMADGGEIDWGADLGGGFSVGNDVYITDPKSLFQGKTGFVSGAAGRDLLVTLMDNGNERSVVVSKKGVEKLDAPEYAKGGKITGFGSEIEKSIKLRSKINATKSNFNKAKKYKQDIEKSGDSVLINYADKKILEAQKEYDLALELWKKEYGSDFQMAHGGYVIFEGRDNYNDKPLYKVISKDEDNDYDGEFHDNREDAEKELNELKNKDMNYAKGGNTDALKKIKDYYVGAFPTDDLGQEINADATFNGLSMVLNDKGDVYEYLGVADSLVRERVFEKLSKIEGVSYDVIYDKWLDYDYANGGYMADGGEITKENLKIGDRIESKEADYGVYVVKSLYNKDPHIWEIRNDRGDRTLGEGELKFWKFSNKMADGGEVGNWFKEGSDKWGLEKTEIFIQEKDGKYEVNIPTFNQKSNKWEFIKHTFDSLEEAKEDGYGESLYEKGGYMAKGGQVPAHFGSGKNIEVFGYETKNFDICGTAVKEFEAAVDIMKDSKELEKESLAYCAKYVDNLFGIEKVVVEGGIGGELNFSHAVSDIMSASTYNFRAGMAINLYSFVPQHLMEIALRLAKAEKGGFYALGGMTAGRWYKDASGEEFKFIGKVDSGANKGRFLFSDGQKSVYKDLEEFEGGKPKETKLFGFFADGGSVAEGNYEMLMSNIKAIKHHAEELAGAVTPNTEIEAWVLSKSERAETDLSDITHYLDGLKMEKGGYMADGGQLGKETITLKSYNIYGKEINSGDVIVDYDNKTIELPSGKTYKVENDYKYTIKVLKSKIKASGGINGLVEFLKEINTSDSPFNPSFTNQLINGFDKYAEGGELSSIKDEYLKNEDENAHSENVVLLAKHFGTKEDLAKAKEILALHEKEGSLSSENGKKRQELHLKLIKKATKEMSKEGIEFEKGGYMAMGGETEDERALKLLNKLKEEGKLKRYLDVRGNGKKVFDTIIPNKSEKGVYKRYESTSQSSIGTLQNEYLDESDVLNWLKKTMPKKEMAKGGEFGFKPYGKTKGKFKITYMADGKKQSETWETKEMAINNAKRYASPKMNGEYTNIKVFDENGKSVEYMAMGGKVKFADKVKSVQESLLKRKKVAPQVQKDYGKTYSKAEAKESAQRIVGSRMAQLKEKMAKKKK